MAKFVVYEKCSELAYNNFFDKATTSGLIMCAKSSALQNDFQYLNRI